MWRCAASRSRILKDGSQVEIPNGEIDRGGRETSPSWTTLTRLLKAAGFRLTAALKRIDVDPALLDDVPRILRLTPEDRLREAGQVSRFISAARRV